MTFANDTPLILENVNRSIIIFCYFQETFRDFILEHYSEDGCHYDDQLNELMDLRQAMRTPTRDNNGISLLFEYYNQLYFVE